jgi:hypothetical protein
MDCASSCNRAERSSARAQCLLAVSMLALMPAIASAERVHHYDVTVARDLSRLSIHACFDGTPARLYASAPQAARFLRDLHVAGAPARTLSTDDQGLALEGVAAGECVDYAVDVTAAINAELGRFAGRWERDVTTAPQLWLWRPTPADPDADIEVTFDLPGGLAVSAPWQLVARHESKVVYRVGHTPEDWPGIVAFGRFQVDDIEVPGALLRVALIDADPPADPHIAHAWVERAARAVATLYGEFPLASPQILLFPRGHSGEPVPWGLVVRGGGAAAQLYFDKYRSLADLDADWTATHELSHMLLPYLDDNATWLSEGFASYYQNVLRARAGMLTSRQAWEELAGGFERGRRDTRDESLEETTRNMGRERAFMRVYWSGAAFVLLADLRLRRETDGRQSLDTALAELRRCCLPSDRYWSGRELLDKLDAITGTKFFPELADGIARSREFPDLSAPYHELGLRIENGALQLDAEPRAAALRDAIMRPR